MKIIQLETKGGSVFRVAIENKKQEQRLINIINKNKSFINIDFSKLNGVHNIKEFEKITNTIKEL